MKFIELLRPRTDSPEPKYSPEQKKDIKLLFTLSFQYSQGNDTLQSEMFRWLMVNGYFPYSISNKPPQFALDIKPPLYHMDTGTLIQTEQDVVRGDWHRINKVSTEQRQEKPIKKPLIETITQGLLERELKYQIKPRPGRSITDITEPDSKLDPHKSFFRRHIVQKNPCGHHAFDLMFEEIAKATIESEKPGKFDQQVSELARLWDQNHIQSGETFFQQAA